tara:strand:+ start:1019 stop:1270 length:252 start_codon:yes stop_codon:yes gene_type:complete
MNLKYLNNILVAGFLAFGTLPALAEGDHHDDSFYDQVYEQCNQVAEKEGGEDRWQHVFDECMAKHGIVDEEESYEEEDMHESH